ncbi:hypothetical protein D3C83_137780 [compost metagenome]
MMKSASFVNAYSKLRNPMYGATGANWLYLCRLSQSTMPTGATAKMLNSTRTGIRPLATNAIWLA